MVMVSALPPPPPICHGEQHILLAFTYSVVSEAFKSRPWHFYIASAENLKVQHVFKIRNAIDMGGCK